MNYQKELEFAKNLAKQAGEIMLKYFDSATRNTLLKKDQTPVTVADVEINELVIDTIQKEFPTHGVWGEEKSAHNNEDNLWICDPIDGTFPYAHSIPTAVFSLAICVKGEPVVAVVYDPFQDRLYSCEKGQGVFLNDARLPELANILPANSQLAVDIEAWTDLRTSVISDDTTILGDMVNILEAENVWFGVFNSAVYGAMQVVRGDYSGIIYSGKKPWDAVTAELMISELGGNTSDFTGKKQMYHKEIYGFLGTAPYFTEQLQRIVDTVVGK